MKKLVSQKILVLDDNDMNCSAKNDGIKDMSLKDIGFSMMAIQSYDMVIYEGSKGTKILKSAHTKIGLVI